MTPTTAFRFTPKDLADLDLICEDAKKDRTAVLRKMIQAQAKKVREMRERQVEIDRFFSEPAF